MTWNGCAALDPGDEHMGFVMIQRLTVVAWIKHVNLTAGYLEQATG